MLLSPKRRSNNITDINVIDFVKVSIILSTDMKVARIGGRKTWLARQDVYSLLPSKI